MAKVNAHQRYRLKDKTIVVGVTTVTNLLAKPQLVPWANKLGLRGIDVNRFVDDKASIGTLAHDMILCHFKNEACDTSDYSSKQIDAAENSFLSFLEWEKSHEIEVTFVEKQLVSEQYRFGGTIDLFGKIDGIATLTDFKTGSGIFDEYFIQVGGGYRQLLNENECNIDRVTILNIPRTEDESFKEETKVDTKDYWEMFYHLLQIYYLRKGLK